MVGCLGSVIGNKCRLPGCVLIVDTNWVPRTAFALAAASREEDNTSLCGKCGTVYPISSLVCPTCGSNRVVMEKAATRECPTCGYVIGREDLICPRCKK